MSERSFRFKILAAMHCLFIWVPSRRRAIRKFGLQLQHYRCSSQPNSQVEDDISTLIVIPKLPYLCKCYYIISTSTHILNALINIAIILKVEENLTGKNSIYCHSPRLTMQTSLGFGQKYAICFSLLFSALHIVFRWFMFHNELEFKLNLVYYLLWDEKSAQFDSLMSISPTKALLIQQMRQNILFVKVDGARSKILPRPNRTVEARDKMIKAINKLSTEICSIMFVLAITLLLPALWSIFADQRLIYTNCSVTPFDTSYWIRSILSSYITLIHFIECFLSLFIPAAACSVFINDLTSYWLAIEVRLKRLREHLSINRVVGVEFDYVVPKTKLCRSEAYSAGSSGSGDEYSPLIKYSTDQQLNTEEEIFELQSMLNDIFEEIRHLDEYVSILLLFVLMNWFAANGLMSVIGLQIGASVYIIRGFQINAVFIMCIISKYCLNIIDNTRPAYDIINTLLVLDSSVNKKRWLSLLDNYTHKPCYGFTILSYGIFTRLTVLKIFAYTFSFSYIMETLW